MDELARKLANLAGNSPLKLIEDPFPEPVPICLFLKRDDLLHPLVSGNKWRKLKYNLLAARKQQLDTLLTFGGAYSNHLYATAAAGQVFGFRTIGVVRGDELAGKPLNTTLAFCHTCGMQLHFVSRNDYRRKEDADFQDELKARFGPLYLLPEGGTNDLAIQGTAEIIPEIINELGYVPDFVCCPVGTGGTVAGLVRSAPEETSVLGFMVLKVPDSLWLSELFPPTARGCRVPDYHFGGYAKTTPELLNFIRTFEQKTGIRLEQVYTGKMLYGIYDLARQGYFPEGASVVAVHTGGLQGRSSELDLGQSSERSN
ncbi:1-aminocyclopropane-1-carboxylate deaminase/D-cysteine desulfhydrase [Spirosoma fluviale]|uniref:1-aminocyclopropane-1-carboxylate deaminase/D-cysteine desulfhydrase, PLP-dependent ACC family n=1 Tax=Spirosoma fluviale TaxID=1597977 RepID=A0A286FAR0_9BACT|nr:pyridoxal-phosphate dependent enzyme [Spirosoma fluviale]SOD80327.1 1-aminocyclopropane-1-carboxylate deaminase/D-cysteine desulfhydrase, PLP-dependent ACC family [Spirosoma fluviale]